MVTPYIELYDPNALHELLMWVQDWLPLQVQPTLDCSFRCFEINKIKAELINQKYPRVSKEVWPSQSNQPAHSFPYRLTPNSYGASFDNRKDLKLDPPLLRACMYCWVWVEKKTNKDLSLHAVWFYVQEQRKGPNIAKVYPLSMYICTESGTDQYLYLHLLFILMIYLRKSCQLVKKLSPIFFHVRLDSSWWCIP